MRFRSGELVTVEVDDDRIEAQFIAADPEDPDCVVVRVLDDHRSASDLRSGDIVSLAARSMKRSRSDSAS